MPAPSPRTSATTSARAWRAVPLGIVLAATLYAGLRARPEMRGIPGVPASWGDWLDVHDFWKNAAGFAVLAAATHLAFPGHVRRNAVGLVLLVVGIELAQQLLPRRVSDVNDVVAGGLGVAIATGIWLAARTGCRRREECS